MAVNFIKADYRFTYFDICNEKHVFDFIQYTDTAAIRTIDELFRDSEVIPISLYNVAKGVPVFDEKSKFCMESVFA